MRRSIKLTLAGLGIALGLSLTGCSVEGGGFSAGVDANGNVTTSGQPIDTNALKETAAKAAIVTAGSALGYNINADALKAVGPDYSYTTDVNGCPVELRSQGEGTDTRVKVHKIGTTTDLSQSGVNLQITPTTTMQSLRDQLTPDVKKRLGCSQSSAPTTK